MSALALILGLLVALFWPIGRAVCGMDDGESCSNSGLRFLIAMIGAVVALALYVISYRLDARATRSWLDPAVD